MLNSCIIAIHFESKYYTVKCHFKDSPNILSMLETRCPSESDALRFIAMGDIELQKGSGLLLTGIQAIKHQSSLALVTYAVNSGANNLFVYEDYSWEEIPLEREEILDIAANE